MNRFIIFLKNNKYLSPAFGKIKYIYFRFILSDEALIKKKFKMRLNREVELENPIKYNDKIQWLKLNYYNPLAAKCADKYEVRKFVKSRVGSHILNEVYCVYDSVEQIELSNLPSQFVLKGTHGSGFNIICTNKEAMNWKNEYKKMKNWLKTNYYWQNREWVYKEIKPRIICEKYLQAGKNDELRDYRVFCFNGKPKFIAIDFNINDKQNCRRNLYDLEWNLLDHGITHPRETDLIIDPPKQLNKMLEYSEKLSKDFPHVRVDFFIVNDNLYFSELTFFHQSGMGIFDSESFEEEVGSWLKLPSQEDV